MTKSAQVLQAYPFSSQFETMPLSQPGEIRLSADELALLLQQNQQTTAELVRNEILQQTADQLDTVSKSLQASMADIVRLAAYLEKAGLDEIDRQQALDTVRNLASTLLRGQGELFPET